MPWCSKCGTEYRDELETCESCNEPVKHKYLSMTGRKTRAMAALLQVVTIWAVACVAICLFFLADLLPATPVMSIASIIAPLIGGIMLAFAAGYFGAAWFDRAVLWIGWTSAIVVACVLNAVYMILPDACGKLPGFTMMVVSFLSTLAMAMRSGIRDRELGDRFQMITPFLWLVLMLIIAAIVIGLTLRPPAPD